MIGFTERIKLGNAAGFCALLLVAAGCLPNSQSPIAAATQAEEDHDLDPIAVTVFTKQLELFMEYPQLLPGLEARYLAHLTVLATGEPIRSGQLQLELTGSDGVGLIFKADKPTRDGLFIPVGALQIPGEYQAKIVLQSDQANAEIVLPPIIVHADQDAAHDAAHATEVEEPANAVPFLLEQQWKIGLLMQVAVQRTLVQRLQVPGQIEAPTSARAVVSTPLAGRLMPPESGKLPQIGDHVEKGQILALLEPPLTLSDNAQLVANRMTLDALELEIQLREFDLQAKAMDAELAVQQSQVRLAFAQKNLARIEGLSNKGLVTTAELEAARQDVQLSVREIEGAKAAQASYEQARLSLIALRTRSESAQQVARPEQDLRIPLVAPISGELVAVHHVEGEYLEGQAAVYQLIDLSSVWVTAQVSEFDLADLQDQPGALLECPAYPERSFDLLGEMNGRMINFGRVVDPDTRTITLRYEAPNPQGLFCAGMFADVFLETRSAVDAVALPQQAIVMDNGRPIAFVLLDGETFQKRQLELGIRDGDFVEIRSGLTAGERVVTDGAYLVKLASASPSAFGPGHAH